MEGREIVIELAKSPRGQYLIGQALAIASQSLRAADHPRKEVNNAEEMERLGTLFEPFFSAELADPNPVHVNLLCKGKEVGGQHHGRA
jgi:hypothetical protein